MAGTPTPVPYRAAAVERRPKTSHQIEFELVFLRPFVQIQNLVVLSETVAVEVAIRVVEQDALCVQVSQRLVAFDGLAKCGRVLERESVLAELPRYSIHLPSSPPAASRWPSSTRTRLLPSNASMAMALSPSHPSACGCRGSQPRAPANNGFCHPFKISAQNTCRLKVAQMLLAQSFVWGEQDNAINFAPATVFL